MSNQKNIQDELKGLESSLPVNNNQPFSVPEGYFEGLAAAILAKVKINEYPVQAELDEISPLLAGIPKRMPYSVPFSYFEENIVSINGRSEETDSRVLTAVGKTMPYTVPLGYFEDLPEKVLGKVAAPKAKVVPLFARTWMRVATAAAIIGALFFGGYQLLLTKTDGAEPLANQRLVDTTQNQMAANSRPGAKEMKKVSTEELEDFIENVQADAVKPPVKRSANSDNEELEELLKDVSTTEMEKFLSAIPTLDDEFLITD